MKRWVVSLVCLSALAIPQVSRAEAVSAELPFVMSVQLRTPRNYLFKFSLWDAADAGTAGETQLWSETKLIRLTTRKLRHRLGSVDPSANPLDPALFSQQLWVQVERCNAVTAACQSVGARQKLSAVPYAFSALRSGVTAGTGTIVTGDAVSVDTAVIQQRVTGSCTEDAGSLSAVAADGSVTCRRETKAWQAESTTATEVTTNTVLASVLVDSGFADYAVNATTSFLFGAPGAVVECTITPGTTVTSPAYKASSPSYYVPMSLSRLYSTECTGWPCAYFMNLTFRLVCTKTGPGTVTAGDSQINVIRIE